MPIDKNVVLNQLIVLSTEFISDAIPQHASVAKRILIIIVTKEIIVSKITNPIFSILNFVCSINGIANARILIM